MKPIFNTVDALAWQRRACAVFALHAATAIALPAQTFTTLHSFCSQSGCADGLNPGGLVQGISSGDLYGSTIFSLSVGLGAFVKAQPSTGKVGAVVEIVGNNLTGTTSVTFNGIAAAFVVNSTGTAIATEVPVGATTGTVQVVTPSGPLSSYPPFSVIP